MKVSLWNQIVSAAEHDDQHQADPQHGVDLAAAQLQPGHLGQRGDDDHHGGQQHRRLVGADHAAGDQEAEVAGGEGGGPFLVASAYLKAAKNRMIGRKSKSSFMRSAGDRLGQPQAGAVQAGRLEVDRGRVDAVALAGRRRAVVEHVAEVRAALRQRTSMRTMPWLASRTRSMTSLLIGSAVARPAAAGVELGATRTAACRSRRSRSGRREVVPVLAAEGALGGGVARHLVLHRVELGAPFGVGLVHRVARVVVVVGLLDMVVRLRGRGARRILADRVNTCPAAAAIWPLRMSHVGDTGLRGSP